jgi:ABC-type transporter Mla subunit MlaD
MTMPLPAPMVSLPLHLVADVQDALLMALTDLRRLDGLLDHATAKLLERFGSVDEALAAVDGDGAAALARIRPDLQQAVTELQFHDMATQLIVHTGQLLQGCAWRLAEAAIAPEDGELPLGIDPLPQRPSPVTQSEMDAGSVELF